MLIQKRAQFDRMVKAIETAPVIFADVETTGLDLHGGDKVVGIAVYVPGHDAYYLPTGHGTGAFTHLTPDDVAGMTWAKKDRKLVRTNEVYAAHVRPHVVKFNAPPEWVDELKAVWTRPAVHVYHNATFDLTALTLAGFPRPAAVHDTMVAAHLLNTDWGGTYHTMPDTGSKERGNKRLKWLARLFEIEGAALGEDLLKDNCLAMTDRLKAHDKHVVTLDLKGHLWALPPSDVELYACTDVRITAGLYDVFLPALDRWGLRDAFTRLCDIQYRLAWSMHMTGFRVDPNEAEAMVRAGYERAAEIAEEWRAVTGRKWADKVRDENLNPEGPAFDVLISSPAQICQYLKEVYGIDTRTVDKGFIAAHVDTIPELDLVARYREMTKLTATYADKWYQVALKGDGVIHPSFNVAGPKTGRWSSSDSIVGNFQNIPGEVHKDVAPKSLLRAVDPSYWLFEVDYSALESRVGAWVAETLYFKGRDLTMSNLIASGADMHAYTRDQVGIPELVLAPYHGDVESYYRAQGVNVDDIDGDVYEYFVYHDKHGARYKAKTLNFLAQYGGTGAAVSKLLRVPRDIGDVIVARWNSTYPAVAAALAGFAKLALKRRPSPSGHGAYQYVRYPFDMLPMVRRYDLLDASAYSPKGGMWSPRHNAARNTFNSVVQGTSALMNVNAAYEWALDVRREKVPHALHAAVHDSVVISLPVESFTALRALKYRMEEYDTFPKLAVEFEAVRPGGSWADKRPVTDLDLFIQTGGREGLA